MRAWKAALLFFPLLGLAAFLVYFGTVLGKGLILLGTYYLSGLIRWLPVGPDIKSAMHIAIIVLLVVFGLIFGWLSAIGGEQEKASTGLISRGLLSCIIAGMAIGVIGRVPSPDEPIWRDEVQGIFTLVDYEWYLLAIGVGIMLYYFFAAVREGS